MERGRVFAFRGAWLYSKGRSVVHLVDFSPTDEAQKPDPGVVHHVASSSLGSGMKRRLQARRVEFESRQVLVGALWRIFVRDPNGVMVELNYHGAARKKGWPRRHEGSEEAEVER
jgi:hypothetical protein